MEDHSFDLIALRPLSGYNVKEKQKLSQVASLLVMEGSLQTPYQDDELPILVAGLAKHSKLKPIRVASRELIELLKVSMRKALDKQQVKAASKIDPKRKNHALKSAEDEVRMYRGVRIAD